MRLLISGVVGPTWVGTTNTPLPAITTDANYHIGGPNNAGGDPLRSWQGEREGRARAAARGVARTLARARFSPRAPSTPRDQCMAR